MFTITLEQSEFINLMQAARLGLKLGKGYVADYVHASLERAVNDLENRQFDDSRTDAERKAYATKKLEEDIATYGSN